ncbi:MAG TPA: hypothetical protein VEM57_07620, partial [Candidatus Binatus sp.]|nr:hypothetical protein [Candidatus Binatus sp.]
MSAAKATCSFVLLSGAALFLVSRDLRPPPLYRTLAAAGTVAVFDGQPLSLECDLPRAPSGFLLPVSFPRAGSSLRVRLLDDAGAELVRVSLDESALIAPYLAAVVLPPGPPGPQRIRLEFSSDVTSPVVAPVLQWSRWPPGGAATVRAGTRQVRDRGPVLLLEYPWPSRNALWLWLLVIPVTVLALRDERRFPPLLVLVSFVAMTTSVLLWQRDYVRHFA